MAASEKIRCETALTLWKALADDKTPLILKTEDGSHQWSVTGKELRGRLRKHYLVVPGNDSLRSTLEKFPDTCLAATFTDRNQIPHTCVIQGCRLTRSEIWLEIPDSIERHQRRRIFRLEAPSGSELNFTIGSEDYRLLLIDISVSGAQGIMAHRKSSAEKTLRGSAGRKIENVVLIFQAKKGTTLVHIAECTVRRIEPHEVTGKMQCALEFTVIDEDNEQLLTEMIYEFQREFLRRRHRSR